MADTSWLLRPHQFKRALGGRLRMIPSGISCGNECKQNFASGTVVTLMPAPALTNGVTFFGWSGACSGKNACTVTMDGAKQVGAGFSSTGL